MAKSESKNTEKETSAATDSLETKSSTAVGESSAVGEQSKEKPTEQQLTGKQSSEELKDASESSSIPAESVTKSTGEKRGSGIEPNVAGTLAWIVPVLAIVFLFTDPDDKFIKFHSLQSLIYMVVGYTIIYTVITVFTGFLSIISFGILGLCTGPLYLAPFIVNVLGAVKAYNNEMWELPIVGSWVKDQL